METINTKQLDIILDEMIELIKRLKGDEKQYFIEKAIRIYIIFHAQIFMYYLFENDFSVDIANNKTADLTDKYFNRLDALIEPCNVH